MSKYPDVLKYYMWGYQIHHRISCKVTADSIFNEIDPDLNPNVTILGFAANGTADAEPICIEPEDSKYTPEIFAGLHKRASEKYESNPSRFMHYSGPGVQEEMEVRQKNEGFRAAVEEIMNELPDNKNQCFVSDAVKIGKHFVFIVLELDKQAYKKHTFLTTKSYNDIRIYQSLIETCISEFLSDQYRVLHLPNPGKNLSMDNRSSDDILRAGANSFMHSVAIKGRNFEGLHGLFKACNNISCTRYEGHENQGHLIITYKDDPSIEYTLKLKEPFQIKNTRQARKMLQLSSENVGVICDSNLIYGLGKVSASYDGQDEGIFNIVFRGTHCWDVYHNGDVILQVRYGIPVYQTEIINKQKFLSDACRIFPGLTMDKAERLYSLALAATRQTNGAMLIMSDQALAEAERLKSQCFIIEPLLLTDDDLLNLTSIDGGVLIDIDGYAHANGVILDGVAGENGDASRGSRYNSSVRYLETYRDTKNIMIVVVSEDGLVNVLPDLLPQVKHSEIVALINLLKVVAHTDDFSAKNYNQVLAWLRQREFYLTQEECNIINHEIEFVENGELSDSSFRIVRHEFAPNPLMNSSFYAAEDSTLNSEEINQ